ncbi:UNVERIFIED_CONTAM: hypothetical protein PYX00_003474 [Menopon gallinae]|uniref:Uncharacterized protein n=1 Tax=Menopon gallinae TaxID=328185 RepID=A0AAW2I183_9NEOP
MRRASCLLVIALACVILPISSTPIPEATEEPKPEAKPDEKKDGDLDLETQDQVAILKQINRVNEDGSYTFGYEAADGSFKIETRDVNGNVKGMFGFINEDGELKRVSYSASNGTGFQTSGTFNVPSLPGTSLSSDEEADGPYRNIPPQLLRQRLFPKQDASTRITLLPPSTTSYDDIRTTELIPTPRLPIYIFSTTPTSNDITTTIRPVVIQHIPKVRPSPATSVTETTESEEVDKRTTVATFGSLLPKKTSNTNYVTLKSGDATTEVTESEEVTTKKPSVIQVIRPRTGPFKKVIVTKRPIAASTPKTITTTEFYSNEFLQRLREKNQQSGVRRQLDFDNNYSTTPENANLITSGTEDSPDVYGGSPTPRPYTTVAYRTLFTQVPQHQRILQNSYIQNQNQFLAASVPPQINPYGLPGQAQDPARLLPAPPLLPDNIGNQPINRPEPPRPEDNPQRNFPIPSQPLNRIYPNPIPVQPNYQNTAPLQPTPYDNAPYNPQLYIPPGLLEQLIRMLLSVRAYQQQMISPDNPLVDNRYGPYPQSPLPIPSPYPNYSQGPYPFGLQYVPRTNYDPRLGPYPGPFPNQLFYPEPRINNFQPPNPYRPVGYGPFQGRLPFQPNQNPYLVGTLLNGRPPIPTGYSPQVPDSTTSSTTSKPRIGSVRNVQILNPNSEDSEESEKFERDVKL